MGVTDNKDRYWRRLGGKHGGQGSGQVKRDIVQVWIDIRVLLGQLNGMGMYIYKKLTGGQGCDSEAE